MNETVRLKYAPHTERFGDMDSAIERYFQVSREIDWATVNRLQDIAAEARAEMGESRWQSLNAEWETE